jgi:hypothetical protein
VPLSGRPVPPALLNNLTLRPLARGPLPGSVVVEGQGREIAGLLLRQGIVMLAAPSAICGMPQGHEGMMR